MRIAVVTSRGCKYPSLHFPQYLDQDNCFASLASEAELSLIGNILERRPYARSHQVFTSRLNLVPALWNNRLLVRLSRIPPLGKLRDWLDGYSDALYSRDCFPYLMRQNVDAIYSFPWPSDRYVVQWARKLGKPLVIEMWEDYACFASLIMKAIGLGKNTIDRETGRCYRWMQDVAGGADRVIVPSRVLAERLREYGVSGDKIRVVPVCVDPSVPSDIEVVRERHRLRDDETVVFHIGGLAPWHDMDTMIKAVPYLLSKFVFIIAGRRDEALEARASLHAHANVRLIFTGRLDPQEVDSYLALADICVAPYRFPGPSGFFPAKVIRYMHAGKATVATDVPEIREMFQGKEAGILVPQQDPGQLAVALERLSGDALARARMGLTGREIAEGNYLVKHHTEQLMQVFREIA